MEATRSPVGLAGERSRSSFDRRHRFESEFNIDLPFGSRRRFLAGCGAGLVASAMPWDLAAQSPRSPGFGLVDVTTAAGLAFRHNNGAFGGKYLPETMGSGCAFVDYDNDGWQDILLVQGMDWPGRKKQRRTTMRLYRNRHDGTFTDVTRAAGLDVEMYGMGVAVGDYNNDGFQDLFISAVGQSRLFRNTGKGRFEEVTRSAGDVARAIVARGAAYGDYDRDTMVLWLWNERGARRIEDPRSWPTFFLHAPPSELPTIRRRIEILDGVREVREVARRIALEDDEPKPVLEIVPRHYRDMRELAHILDSNGGYVDHRLFNVDLRFSQRYAMEHDIFPLGLVRYANGTWLASTQIPASGAPVRSVTCPLTLPRRVSTASTSVTGRAVTTMRCAVCAESASS